MTALWKAERGREVDHVGRGGAGLGQLEAGEDGLGRPGGRAATASKLESKHQLEDGT